jgi:hypothetical protein
MALLSATSLSFVITATDIGVRIGKLRGINATAIVGAAVLAMVIFRWWRSRSCQGRGRQRRAV